MKRRVIFDKPSVLVDIDNLPNGAIFLVDEEPYMRIRETKDSFGDKANSVYLCSGELQYWENEDAREYNIEYFPNHQNIKIVGD